MKTHRIAASLALIGMLSPASAEIFVMKDGSRLEGKILKKDAETYLLEVNVTKSIKDEKLVKRSDVVEIKRDRHDLIAFKELEKLVPTPDYLSADDYAERIGKVEKFMKDYGSSVKWRAAKKILKTLQDELEVVEAGGVKSGGSMISAEDYRANAYDLDAGAMAARVRDMVDKRQYLSALRTFEAMGEDFKNTMAYRDLAPTMLKVMRSYLASVQTQLDSFDERMKQREVQLNRMSPADRQNTANAIAEKVAGLKARYEKEKAARVGWVTSHPDVEESLSETISYGKSATSRLTSYLKSEAKDGGKYYRETMQMLLSGPDPAEAKSALSKARSFDLPEKYYDNLEALAPEGK